MGFVDRRTPSQLRPPVGRPAYARGFTLLELLVVMAIVAISVGAVAWQAGTSDAREIRKEAQRIALLLQLGRDEAILRSRPVAFDAEAGQYRFLVRDNNRWLALGDDGLLRQRSFARAPVAWSITPPQAGSASGDGVLRIVLGREPVDQPFLLTLSLGSASASIRADGVGHFSVE